MRKIAVAILGYNHRKFLKDVFESVLLQSYEQYDVFYIDNVSQDNSLDFVKKEFPSVTCIENTKNLGYAGAYKQFLDTLFSQGKEYDGAVLLNPDVVTDTYWLEKLVYTGFSADDIACAQSMLYLWKGKKTKDINSCGNKIHYLGIGYCGCYKQKKSCENAKRIAYASGASVLIKKEIYCKIPGLDKDFFAYLEDQDLGWQCNILGYRNIIVTDSIAWHKYEFHKTKNYKKMYLLERNRLVFLLKYYEWKTLVLIFPAFIFFEIGIFVYSLSAGFFIEKCRAYGYFFWHLPEIVKKRKRIQEMRVVRDKDLFLLLSREIQFEDIQSPLLRYANKILVWWYKFISKYL